MARTLLQLSLVGAAAAFVPAPQLAAPSRAAAARPAVSMKVDGLLGAIPPMGYFDPLGLSDKLGRTAAAEAEIYNGRLAMLAITGFAMQEALWGQPVVDQWSIFFKPAF